MTETAATTGASAASVGQPDGATHAVDAAFPDPPATDDRPGSTAAPDDRPGSTGSSDDRPDAAVPDTGLAGPAGRGIDRGPDRPAGGRGGVDGVPDREAGGRGGVEGVPDRQAGGLGGADHGSDRSGSGGAHGGLGNAGGHGGPGRGAGGPGGYAGGSTAAAPAAPTFSRPPGMVPPPDQLDNGSVGAPPRGVPASAALSSPSGSYPTVHASAPVSAPPRSIGRAATGAVTVQPIGPSAPAGGAAPVRVPARPRPAATPRGPRRARLAIKRIDPWSVMKFSFAVSLVLFIVVIVAAAVLYLALDTMGVFTSINSTVAELIESGGGEGEGVFQITASGVIGAAAVFGALNVLLFTSLATLGAFIYNVCADLVGGVEVTLAERD